ncbi:anillin-like isoform X2 [Mixophyes fleayi]|uniref:anillin-like isoform X2 n=1 Tax=Mixophyes fleayi TaxID=3061075 RepID=UPI003F4DEA9C
MQEMEVKRHPLKRLCPDSVNESPRKRRFTVSEDEKENRDPTLLAGSEVSSRGSWSSLLRIAEQEIKPDTPAIPSVRSRIQMLRDISMRDTALDAGEDSDGVSWTENRQNTSLLADPVLEAETVTDWDLNSGDKLVTEERLTPQAHSTLSIRGPLLSKGENLPSEETASRLRKERQEELAMVCTVLDHNNPWRVESMRQRQKRVVVQASVDLCRGKRRRRVRTGRGRVKMGPLLETNSDSSGSESVELSLESSDRSLDVSDDRCVSSLVVQLRGTCHSDSPSAEEPPSTLCGPADIEEGLSSDCVDEGRSQVTMNSSELIDHLFEDALEAGEYSDVLDADEDSEEIELPPVSILSPLTKSVDIQAAISPLNSVVSSLPELLMDPPVIPKTSPDKENHLLYSIDRYRTLRRNVLVEANGKLCPPTQSHHSERRQAERVTADLKERIKLLSKEVSALQRIIEQSCSALSYCVDAEHGKGTRQEAEAERLLLVSTEKKVALLKELERLRAERSENPESGPTRELTPCRGSVSISDIQLPLKVDYVCSTLRGSGPTGHYFLILIRFGTHDVVATPLASAADAQTGDTIIFPTTVTLNDAASDFRIEIEVYSLAHSGSLPVLDKRKSLKPKITPKKLLSSRKSSLNSPACSPAVNAPLRSSSFLLVGSLNLSLQSLGKFKFPLEKMKLEGKVGRLLGNHFQDKVPFLSPLEGNLNLKLQCQSHSSVQRSGFLTIFEDVGGLGAWHRRWCVLSGNCLSLWAYPDQEACKEPLARINLVNCTSAKIEAAKRESCARTYTLELITMRPQREDDMDTLVTQCRNTLCFTKNWLSADTREEKDQWMDCLNQVLLDLRTWGARPGKVSPNQPASQLNGHSTRQEFPA